MGITPSRRQIPPMNERDVRRFWNKVQKGDGCWLWKGWTRSNASGYGLFAITFVVPIYGSVTANHAAHRIAYILTKGQIPDNLDVMHLCNTPRCVKPDHLELGTPADNAAYKVLHGRQACGERTTGGGGRTARPWRRLTEAEVLAIRRSHAERQQHYSDLARQYNVHWRTIAAIVHGTSWKHVTTVPEYVALKYKSGLSLDEIKALKLTPLNGSSLAELANAFGVSKPAILHVVNKTAWKHI